MSPTATFVRAEDFATRKVAGETILVPIRRGVADLECVYTLDEVASAIWRSLETPKTVEAIVADIVREFEVPDVDARRDAEEFLANLEGAGLVTASPAP